MGEDYFDIKRPKGVRGTLKIPYDMKKWNKAELLFEIRRLNNEIAHLRDEKTLHVPWYKKIFK